LRSSQLDGCASTIATEFRVPEKTGADVKLSRGVPG
jgi:hypothetical protein